MFRSGYAHKIKDSPQATCTFSLLLRKYDRELQKDFINKVKAF